MQVINAMNSHEATWLECELLSEYEYNVGAASPVTTAIAFPLERVSYWPELGANPFSDLYKALWALDGGENVLPLAPYGLIEVQQTDDGQTLNGAYGFRAREHFSLVEAAEYFGSSIDQLKSIVSLLKSDSKRRDCVMQLWDAGTDLGLQSKNLPKATQIYFIINPLGDLDITVCYRECDVVQAASDRVTFSMMQTFIAESVGVPHGYYYQIVQAFHIPPGFEEKIKLVAAMPPDNLYEAGHACDDLLMHIHPTEWLQELQMFMSEGQALGMRDRFIRNVAGPMNRAWQIYTQGTGLAINLRAQEIVKTVCAEDWRYAGLSWLQEREE